MSTIVFAVLAVIALGSAGVLALGWTASTRAMHPPRASFPWSLADYPALAAEEIVLTAGDGARLAGRFIPGTSRSTVVLSHGYGGAQDELLPIAQALHDAGLSVFTYDLRGCGDSGGAISFGSHEEQDLGSVLEHLSAREDVAADRIGALGFSMGAAASIMAAARDDRIRALVDDSGWAHVYHWLRPSVRRWLRSPRDHFSPLSLKLVELRTRTRLRRLRPVDVIRQLSPRPLLILHGTADDVVPPGDSEANFAAAGQPKELWLVPGAAHTDTVAPGGAASTGRVTDFFVRSLGL